MLLKELERKNAELVVCKKKARNAGIPRRISAKQRCRIYRAQAGFIRRYPQQSPKYTKASERGRNKDTGMELRNGIRCDCYPRQKSVAFYFHAKRIKGIFVYSASMMVLSG